MATIKVRNLDPDVRRLLQQRAIAHGHSLEDEVRDVLTQSMRTGSFAAAWVSMADEFRAKFGGVELELPERSLPRDIDLGWP